MRALAGAAVVFAAALVVAGLTLPDRVPTHFGLAGDPDAWSSRAGALVTFAVIGVVLAALIAAIGLASDRMPMSLVNTPHKEWWTATPEREADLRHRLREAMLRLAAITLLFLAGILLLTVRAARATPPHLDALVWVLAAAFLAGTWWQVGRLLRRPRLGE